MKDQASSPRVLFSSLFAQPNAGGHGGNRRARQLCELLVRVDPHFAIVRSFRDSALTGLRHADWGSVVDYLRDVRLTAWRRARVALGFARNYGDARRALARYPDARVLVWEDTMNAHMARAAKDAGLRVVAVPQNLESLVPETPELRTGQELPWSFEYELEQLSRADRVYTIAREEQWLLSLRGVDAHYLPFFPDQAQRAKLVELRGRRIGPFDRCLVLGSAANTPTRIGMSELLTWLKATPDPCRLPVHVVGYGTEVLRGLAGNGITVHGAVDDVALASQLAHARVVVLHQRAAVGALIRVSEMLLAGVPVLMNPIAARSTAQYQGVVIYESFPDLAALLARSAWDVPPIPEPPIASERHFLSAIEAWAH